MVHDVPDVSFDTWRGVLFVFFVIGLVLKANKSVTLVVWTVVSDVHLWLL